MSAFYITTPIYYVNSDLHLGHAYTTVLADAMARAHRQLGDEVFFLTGVDEHGQKVLEAAQREGVDPQQHCDEMAARFQRLWQELGISHDRFLRTTDRDHVRHVEGVLQRLHDDGQLYADDYEGLYCVPCERWYTEKDLEDGACPQCQRPVERLRERNWFFRMSAFQQRLVEHIESRPDCILPESRRNEVLGFLRQPLRDLCISRLKERMSWGIELPFDRDYVCYVWVDALFNYLSGLGAAGPGTGPWWPAATHLIGKDILTTHAVYWPTLLMALGIDPPARILAHGWWLAGERKMSKSVGNVIRPLDWIEAVGADAFRFFLLREMVPWNDASFNGEALVKRLNADLANDLGNLLSRVSNLAARHYAGRLPAAQGRSGGLRAAAEALLAGHAGRVRSLDLHGLLEGVFALLKLGNQEMERQAPWKLVASDPDAAGALLADMAEVLRLAGLLLLPVMPGKCAELLARLGADTEGPLGWSGQGCPAIVHGAPLFPRLDAERLGAAASPPPAPAPAAAGGATQSGKAPEAEPDEGLVGIEDFARLKLVAARVLSAEAHPDAERLLLLSVDCGEAEPRRLVAGIAGQVDPAGLPGRMICVVANLRPATIRGQLSQGMLLAAKAGRSLQLLDPGPVPPGTPIG
jgi:methionyl-tRNA synthetase